MKTNEYLQKWTAWNGRCRAAYPYTFCGGEEQSYDNVGKWFQTLHDRFLTKYSEAYQQQVDRVGVIHEDPCNLIHDGLENEPDAMEILLETMREFGDLETTGQ
jgi:hypothetical protein